MTIKIIKPDCYKSSEWSGGKTTELYIDPEGATLKARDFDFRISVATVVIESSDFTKLEGVNRYLSVMEGEMSLMFEGKEQVDLKPYEVCNFQGGWDTRCIGMGTDINLMLRKGQGTLCPHAVLDRQSIRYRGGKLFFYSPKDDVRILVNETEYDLEKNALFCFEAEEISVMIELVNIQKQNINVYEIQYHKN